MSEAEEDLLQLLRSADLGSEKAKKLVELCQKANPDVSSGSTEDLDAIFREVLSAPRLCSTNRVFLTAHLVKMACGSQSDSHKIEALQSMYLKKLVRKKNYKPVPPTELLKFQFSKSAVAPRLHCTSCALEYGEKLPCPKCDRCYPLRSELSRHLHTAHGITDEGVMKCEFCHETFISSPRELYSHVSSHLCPVKHYECPYGCPELVRDVAHSEKERTALGAHIRVNHSCRICKDIVHGDLGQHIQFFHLKPTSSQSKPQTASSKRTPSPVKRPKKKVMKETSSPFKLIPLEAIAPVSDIETPSYVQSKKQSPVSCTFGRAISSRETKPPPPADKHASDTEVFTYTPTEPRESWCRCKACGLASPSRAFVCSLCPGAAASFAYLAQLQLHMSQLHSALLPARLACEICFDQFPDAESLVEHIFMEEHECSSEHLACSCGCHSLCDSEWELELHRRAAEVGDQCEVCHVSVTRNHTVQCDTCPPSKSVIYENEEELKHHSVLYHNKFIRGAIKCPLCPEDEPKLDGTRSFLLHRHQVHNVCLVHVRCPNKECFKVTSADKLQLHEQIHSSQAAPFQFPPILVDLTVESDEDEVGPALMELDSSQNEITEEGPSALLMEGVPSDIVSLVETVDDGSLFEIPPNPTSHHVLTCQTCSYSIAASQVAKSECATCNSEFISLSDQSLHAFRRHNSTYLSLFIKCSYCPQSFAASGLQNTAEHEHAVERYSDHFDMVHSKDRCVGHFSCSGKFCYQLFSDKIALKCHQLVCPRREHASESGLEKCADCRYKGSIERISRCSMCHLILSSDCERIEHEWQAHFVPLPSPNFPVQCSGCDERVARSLLMRHRESAHALCRLHFVCELCLSVFNSKCKLQTHGLVCDQRSLNPSTTLLGAIQATTRKSSEKLASDQSPAASSRSPQKCKTPNSKSVDRRRESERKDERRHRSESRDTSKKRATSNKRDQKSQSSSPKSRHKSSPQSNKRDQKSQSSSPKSRHKSSLQSRSETTKPKSRKKLHSHLSDVSSDEAGFSSPKRNKKGKSGRSS